MEHAYIYDKNLSNRADMLFYDDGLARCDNRSEKRLKINFSEWWYFSFIACKVLTKDYNSFAAIHYRDR